MKALYGFFSLMLSAGVLAAGELTVGDFTDPSCWRATVDRKREKAAIIDGMLKFQGPKSLFTLTLRNYPPGGIGNMEKTYTGIAFKVRGDGSDEWGVISVQAGPQGGGKVYFPLKNTEVVEYRVAFSDMAPNGDNTALPAAKYAAKDITGFKIGDIWAIGQNNYPRKPHSFKISDLRLLDDVRGKFVPGKFQPAPIDGVIAKMKAKQPVLILCVGDSITAGTSLRDREKDRYATVLQGLLRKHYGYDGITVRSVAVGGGHTHDSIAWLDRDLAQGKPDAATMLIGYNNRSAAQKKEVYAEQLMRWIEMFAMKTDGKAAVVLIPTVQGVPRFFSQQDMAEAVYEIGKRYGLTVAPVDKAIAKIGPVEYKKTYLADSIHPNPEGHKLFAEVLLECFR